MLETVLYLAERAVDLAEAAGGDVTPTISHAMQDLSAECAALALSLLHPEDPRQRPRMTADLATYRRLRAMTSRLTTLRRGGLTRGANAADAATTA
jgi:hypothetical protein